MRLGDEQRGNRECADEEKLSQFYADVEEEKRQRDGVLGQADFIQGTSEAKPVK